MLFIEMTSSHGIEIVLNMGHKLCKRKHFSLCQCLSDWEKISSKVTNFDNPKWTMKKDQSIFYIFHSTKDNELA